MSSNEITNTISIHNNDDNSQIKELVLKKYNNSNFINTVQLSQDDPLSKQINETRIIPLKRLRWWIDVPITLLNGTIQWIQMLADSAADTPCANLYWACQNYRAYVIIDKDPLTISTGAGKTINEYCLYFTFPKIKGIRYKCKFILLPNLPAPILADINILKVFGFKFKRVIPPVFRHLALPDADLKIKEGGTKFKMNKLDINTNMNNLNKLLNESNYKLNILHMINTIYSLDKIIYEQTDDNLDHKMCNISCCDKNIFCNDTIDENVVQFLSITESMKATPEEIKKAKELNYNRPIKKPDWTYLKLMEKWKPYLYKDLYAKTMQLIKEKHEAFATHTCDRKTLSVKPAPLGILPEYRNTPIKVDQYPMNKEKRIAMIAYTIEMDKTGFWDKIENSVNNNPYLIILKAADLTGWKRPRPVFDFRKVNEKCKLMDSHMPTRTDYDLFFDKPGIMSLFDLKNYFDCIPSRSEDQKFLVISTPIGKRILRHFSYGLKNAAPIAQDIMNELCSKLENTIGYIDDGTMKHNLNYNTDKLINQLTTLLDEIIKLNALINIGKFYPFCTEVESFGIKRMMYGSTITEKYAKKVLSLPKPHLTNDLRMAIGVMLYISRYICKFAFFAYWLIQLVLKFEDKQRIVWTKEANEAWDALQYLIRNAPIIYTVKRNGKFCLKTDACIYAVGGVLYQLQRNDKNIYIWRITDMHSRVLPKHLRNHHCRLHESYAIVSMVQHWTVYLIGNHFIIATDHKPLIKLFSPYTNISTMEERQIIRMRLAISEFDFTIQYVKGVDTQLADLLSRLRAFLIKVHGEPALKISGDYSPKNHKPLTQKQNMELDQKLKTLTNKMLKIRKQATNAKFSTNNHINITNLTDVSNNVFKNMINEYARYGSHKLKIVLSTMMHDNLTFIPPNRNDTITSQNEVNDLIKLSKILAKCENNTKSWIESSMKQHSKVCATLRSSNKPKPQFIDADVFELDQRIALRRKLIKSLFGHRDINIVFNLKSWPNIQQSDEILSIIYKYLKNAKTFFANKDLCKKWVQLKKEQQKLTNATEKKYLKINEQDIIQIKIKTELDNKPNWKLVVPAILQKLCIDHSHHNTNQQHFSANATLDVLQNWFWWPNMRFDVRKYVLQCIICQFAKGGPTHRTPMRIRELPDAGEVVMGDFMGPFFKKYYLYILICYRTGFTVIVATSHCGATAASEGIITYWMPYFGLFEQYESDMGSAFTSKMFKLILEAGELKQKFAEPRYHQGIGKVERVIGFIQQILRTYNIEFKNKFVDTSKATVQWETIKAMIPFIQFSINRHRSSLTTYSPAILMYGKQFRSISDLSMTISKIENGIKEKKIRKDDQEYLYELIENLKDINHKYKNKWQKMVKVSKQQYDKRYNLAPIRNEKGELIPPKHGFGYTPITEFKKGCSVLYYVGPHQCVNGKWRQVWTGPWTIVDQILPGKFKISGIAGKTKDISGDRLKIFHRTDKDELASWSNYEDQLVSLENKSKDIDTDDSNS